MVAIMMQQQQQTSAVVASQPGNPPSSSSLLRSPTSTPIQSQLPSPLSLGPVVPASTATSVLHRQLPAPVASDHVVGAVMPLAAAHLSGDHAWTLLSRVRFSDIVPYDGAPSGPYVRAVEALSGSLMRHNAVVIELGSEDAALMRCGLESAKLYLRTRAHSTGNGGSWGKGSRGAYVYRAGRALEDWESCPPCISDIFKHMGKVARAALYAIARHLRLRSDVFNHLLDDTPLPPNEVSSSVLVASYSHPSLQNGKAAIGGGRPSIGSEVEKGLLTLISSDSPGLQVCDPNGRWYLADGGSTPGDLLLLTGKALSHATAGLRPAASYRAAPDYFSGTATGGRTSLAFRLLPQGNAVLDCSPIAAAGHVIPQSFVPISVSQFMDDLSAEEDVLCSRPDDTYVARNGLNREPSLRSVLSDPLSGAFLEDAMVVSCGHSFGGFMLRRVIETSRCTLCSAEIEPGSLIPNHVLRAAATAVKHEDERRLFHNASLRKRRKEGGDPNDSIRRMNRENGDIATDDGLHRGVQYPFSVNEKVIIKGNRRTPDKFVGKEAVITSQCLNGCSCCLWCAVSLVLVCAGLCCIGCSDVLFRESFCSYC
ncbi:uncharacterized protein LOC131154055 isoform X1 [Malania oleifera]|uniref:uncharacterized protein LOC131154055 isoform X1 n=1 Tax=Malania oleifera TaxID=397392 RepID=UPI0025AE57BB|nr:uncharacterized protein LOC131154055 isoform X1 [Malania oleifera]